MAGSTAHGGVLNAAGANTGGANAAGAGSGGLSAGGTSAGAGGAAAGTGGTIAGGAGAGAGAGGVGGAPTPVTVKQIATSGLHTCALFTDGTVKCWGYDAYGELGYGNTQNIGDDELPSAVPALQLTSKPGVYATRIALGDDISCAALSDGSLKCWGRNSQNQLGLGNRTQLSNTLLPSALADVSVSSDAARPAELSSAGFHTCVLLSNGTVRCWGLGDVGALGTGNVLNIGDDELPSSIPPLSLSAALGVSATSIACGYFGGCALLSDATIKCWGSGSMGELGFGMITVTGDDELPSAAPAVSLTTTPNIEPIAVTAGDFHACALLSDGSVRCWGHNEYGELGQGNTENIGDDELPSTIGPVPVVTKPNVHVAQLVTGRLHNCALLSDGTVKCWGFNAEGQLGYASKQRSIGDDESIAQLAPIRVTNDPGVFATALSAGGDVTCAVLSDGSAKCWGDNRFGQLGYGNTANVGDDESPASLGPIVFHE